MTRRRLPPKKEDPLRRARLGELLQVAAAFERASRPIPGHVRRDLVFLADLWGKLPIPQQVVDARRVLTGARP